MITIASRVRIVAPGMRYDGMRGSVTRMSRPEPRTLYHVTVDTPFITQLGERADGVWLDLDQLRELKTVVNEVDA